MVLYSALTNRIRNVFTVTTSKSSSLIEILRSRTWVEGVKMATIVLEAQFHFWIHAAWVTAMLGKTKSSYYRSQIYIVSLHCLALLWWEWDWDSNFGITSRVQESKTCNRWQLCAWFSLYHCITTKYRLISTARGVNSTSTRAIKDETSPASRVDILSYR